MSAIRILPENLANQIAAGEVVERPASVVKELLENAVDAGAQTIGIQVEGNATSLIRIIDDGVGMDADDLLLCLERHATSKLRDQAGMAAISTLGFRGEAMPSIAAVSRLQITSRPRGAELAGRVEVSFGTVRRVQEAGAPLGTTIEVRDLFGNVPARRKFLKTARTELYHLEECVRNCGLAVPALGLHYQVDGRTVLQWPAGIDDRAARIRRLLSPGGAGELITVEAKTGIELYGLLPLPEETPATGARLRIFVNGRPVRDRMISHAVGEGLRNQLARGRQPAGVLFIRLDPALVDVNVHPTKQEIRFQQEAGIHDAVRQAVAEAVAAHEGLRRQTLFSLPPATDRPGQTVTDQAPVALAETAAAYRVSHQGAHETSDQGVHGVSPQGANVVSDQGAHETSDQGVHGVSDQGANEARNQGANEASDQGTHEVSHHVGHGVNDHGVPQVAASGTAMRTPVREPARSPQDAVPRGRLHLLGQVLRAYILCESGGALLAIDQHAAHERLLFERLRRQYEEQGLARQALLFPAVLELTAAEAAVLENRAEQISRLGLELEPFGGLSYLVKAVPALLAGAAPGEVVAGVLASFIEEGAAARRSAATLETVLAGMACKAAIKAGQRLEPEEMERLLSEMGAAGLFSRCPHGRPVVRRFEPEEMKRWFHR